MTEPRTKDRLKMTQELRLSDGLGRRFEYLRLSLTEVCNFKCSYCLPDGYSKPAAKAQNLRPDEIARAVRGFARLGLWKLRLTGGEPTVRADFADIASLVTAVDGVRRVAMTTNGYRLAANAWKWRDAGISAVNISVDSLDPARFAAVTGHDRLAEVLAGVDAAIAAGYESVKINAVLMRGINDDALPAMIEYASSRDISLRFIELMRTNDNAAFYEARHFSARAITDQLDRLGWQRLRRVAGAGPAVEYGHPSAKGRVGIIAPYSTDFCTSCNRLRLSATGKLHLCLFGDGGVDLRPLLQRDTDEDALVARIQALTATKAPAHRLHEGNSGATPHLASIGG